MKNFGKEKNFDEKDEQNERDEIRYFSFCFSLFSMSSQSFNDELINVKLKSTKNKTKDFSDPKFAGKTTRKKRKRTDENFLFVIFFSFLRQGFLSENEIHSYQNDVIESNIEQWQKYLSDGLSSFLFSTFFLLNESSFFLRRNFCNEIFSDSVGRCGIFFTNFRKIFPRTSRKRTFRRNSTTKIGFFSIRRRRKTLDRRIFETFSNFYRRTFSQFDRFFRQNIVSKCQRCGDFQ